uniref:NADH dehydrogenase subunit 4L n=1 Tax=Gadomus longifilis TaxID=1355659 RepID=UPI0028D47F6C|nr:NADH dehydrogenase subunit 4L [Gadomus longifilis]WMY90820.1 NADH dehydrogenase subunit 4L [Gadomus longifilis]
MSPLQLVMSSAFLVGLVGFTVRRTHFLSTLLCLEGMMLTLYLMFSLWSLQSGVVSYSMVPVFVLAFSACEASAGLALLVAMVRTHGTGRLKSLNLLQC